MSRPLQRPFKSDCLDPIAGQHAGPTFPPDNPHGVTSLGAAEVLQVSNAGHKRLQPIAATGDNRTDAIIEYRYGGGVNSAVIGEPEQHPARQDFTLDITELCEPRALLDCRLDPVLEVRPELIDKRGINANRSNQARPSRRSGRSWMNLRASQ